LRLAIALALLVCAPMVVLGLPRSETVAVIGPPWAGGAKLFAIVAEAGGSPVRAGGHANIVIAHSPQADFVWRLYAAGAWFVLSPLLAKGCSPFPAEVTS
jgi:hypothetical protein